MAATQRFVMMVDPAERAEWRARAAKAGLTTAEMVRRAVSEYDPDDEPFREALEQLLPELNEAVIEMRESLTRSIAKIDHALDPARDEEARARARAEITPDDIAILGDLADGADGKGIRRLQVADAAAT